MLKRAPLIIEDQKRINQNLSKSLIKSYLFKLRINRQYKKYY